MLKELNVHLFQSYQIVIENVYIWSTGYHHQFKEDFFLGHPVVKVVHCYTVVAAPTGKMEKSWVKRCWSHSVKMGHLENWKGSTKLISRNDKNSLKADKTVLKTLLTEV